ncbi:MAG: hypothetical protein NWE98_00970 [Candidatus Bathyarchaeota archaeon]|nr:hypothetical protein [Candidatus Bathyarchaeota archaeon]
MKIDGKKKAVQELAVPLTVFLAVTIFLTFNIILFPSLVIGDSFNWTPQNVLDIMGPKILRESYMGDVAVMSTFKTGFLFPLTYVLVSLNLPSTLVYPVLFYFLCMLSFYFFSKEFLNNQTLRILVSILYLINPVTPYYFASIINAFSLVMLPLALKFFVRTLKEIRHSANRPGLLKNFALTAFFLALCVSANEQFIFSALLIAIFMIAAFMAVFYRKIGALKPSIKPLLFNLAVFGSVFFLVNLPLVYSLGNVQCAPWSTYFQGPSSSRFLTTVEYTYRNVGLDTVLRLGGDSGTGLGQGSWYDSPSLVTNVFGYVLFALFAASILVLALKKDSLKAERAFFYSAILLVAAALALILAIKSLSHTPDVPHGSFDILLKTWENPSKLRVILLASMLSATLLLFSRLELFASKKRNRLLVGLVAASILVSTVAYNSPWLLGYAGKTPMVEVSDASKWGGIYNPTYASVGSTLSPQDSVYRGIAIPYTHETELYASPNSRVFQIVSQVNDLTSQLVTEQNTPWSKTLGLFSVKNVALMNTYSPNEGLIFPNPNHIEVNQALSEIRSDSGFKPAIQTDEYVLLENQNALPILYASNYYVFYDNLGTLKYAFNYAEFKDLPVFLESQTASGITFPSWLPKDEYRLYAIDLSSDMTAKTFPLVISDGAAQDRQISLDRTNDFQNLTVYTATCSLSSGDTVKPPESTVNQTQRLADATLNSTSKLLGNYGSFTLEFNVNILQNGNYSFLGPRVIIDSGNEQYYIIIHDNGNLELAVQQAGNFKSGIVSRFIGYRLQDPNSTINVKVSRVFDEVRVYVQNTLCMTYITAPKFADVYLASEHSTSAFSKITVTKDSSVRLFAVRQSSLKPTFVVEQSSPERSALTVYANGSDFTVVSQYLYTELSQAKSDFASEAVHANVFFKGWIYNHAENQTYISIGTEGQLAALTLTGFSIAFSYLTLMLLFTPAGGAAASVWRRFKASAKNTLIKGEKTNERT